MTIEEVTNQIAELYAQLIDEGFLERKETYELTELADASERWAKAHGLFKRED